MSMGADDNPGVHDRYQAGDGRYGHAMPGPLAGFTVVEACQMVAGPLAGTICADLGAEVIKVENPQHGDRFRYLGDRVGGISAVWAGVNRGKRSVVLDLQRADGTAIFSKIVAGADVFIQNFRPGVVQRLGIDEPAMRVINPGLIYVSVSGFGDSGPYIDQKSYDYVIQALSGMAAVQADPATGVPALVRNIVIDKVTAMAAAQSILAALLARSGGAGGQHVRLSMLDVALSFLWPDGMMQHTLLADDGRVTPGPHLADNYLVRRTTDDYIALLATSNSQFPGLCAALDRREWLEDDRFSTLAAREANAVELNALIATELERHKGADLVERLHSHDVPCALVNPLDRVHLDPQVRHNNVLVEHDRPWLGRVREPRPPAHFSATPTSLGRHAPKHDEHTDEVLREIGYDDVTIATLRAAGTIGARRS
jgi:crotonobetainyl-CoA:carnitine CoA-transferase CaiB-like acyl-CoA transferase